MTVRPPVQISLVSGENVIANPELPAVTGDTCSYYLKQPTSGDGAVTLGDAFHRSTTRPLRLSMKSGKTDYFGATFNEENGKWVVGQFIGGLNI
jgi:hypothetical protein